jgi:shikimate kinase
MELKAIKKLLGQSHAIISLGGGAFVNDEVREVCQASAITIWLKAKAETILKRIGNKTNRPLLQGENKQEVIEDLIKKRAPYYQKATLAIEEKNNIEETANQIIESLRQLGETQTQK